MISMNRIHDRVRLFLSVQVTGRLLWGIGILVIVIYIVSILTHIPPKEEVVTRRLYMAEAIPVIGDLRLKTELYRYDPGGLPGLVDGTLQTWVEVEGEQTGRPRYAPAVLAWQDGRQAFVSGPEVDTHFAHCLQVESGDLTGHRMRPNHVLYSAVEESDSFGGYLYAIGIYGDGSGLPADTGYAVAEIWNPAVEGKIVATWEQWRSIQSEHGQIIFSCPTTHIEMDPKTALQKGFCWLPPKAIISTDDSKAFEAMLQDMRQAGWEVIRRNSQ